MNKQMQRTEQGGGTPHQMRRSIRRWIGAFRWTKKSVILTMLVLVLIIALVVFLVKRIGGSGQNTITDNGVVYKVEDTVNLAMSSLRSTNPVTSTDEDTYHLSKLVYSSLFQLDENMEPQEDLAASYSFDKSAGTLTLKLRRATWQDGRKVKAADVKFSIEAYKSASKNNYKELVEPIYYVETSGSRTVIIHYNTGARMKLADLTFPILPKHRYSDMYTLTSAKKIHMVGSGPYKAGSYSESTGLKLTPYDDYYGDKPENTIRVSILGGDADEEQLTYSGSISMIISRAIDREASLSADEVKIKNYPSNKVDYIGFNFLKETMTDKNIRKAIASAIDTQSIIQEVYYNSAMRNDNLFYPNYMGLDSKGDAYPYSESKAEKYLAKAGYKDRDDDGYVEDKNGSELTLTFLVNGTSRNKKTASAIKENLESAGIHVTLSEPTGATYASWLKGTNYDFFMGEFQYNESMDLSEILKGTEKTVKYVYDSGTDAGTSDSGSASDSTTGSGSTAAGDENNNSGKYGADSSTSGSLANGQSASGSTSQESGSRAGLKKEESYSATITGSNYTRYYSKRVNSLLERMDSGLTNEEMQTAFRKLKTKLNSDLPYYCLFYRTDGAIVSPSLEGKVSPVFWNVYRGCGTWKTKIETDSSAGN